MPGGDDRRQFLEDAPRGLETAVIPRIVDGGVSPYGEQDGSDEQSLRIEEQPRDIPKTLTKPSGVPSAA